MTFCSIYTEQYVLHKGDIKAAITATLELCENSEVLAEYIREHRPEVQDNMITCLQDQEYVTMIHEKNVRKQALEEGRALGLDEGRAQGIAETEAKFQAQIAALQAEIEALKTR